jgi:tetratricopeptide (TPR) repeat protein
MVALSAGGAAADDLAGCNQAAAKPDEGIPACTRLLANPSLPKDRVLFNRARGHTAKGALDSAIDDYTTAINHNPKNIDALRNRGVIWHRKNEFDRALVDFRQMIALDPNNATAHSFHGFVLTDKGELDRAISDFNTAIRLDGKNAEHYMRRARAFERKHELNRAIADYDQAAKLAPKNGLIFNERAAIFVLKGEYDRAIADYDTAIALTPDAWRTFSARAEAKRWKGDLDGSIADHNEAIRRDPKAPDAYHNRALVWKDKGDIDRALDDLNEAILINPAAGHSWGLRGEIFRMKGDLARSKTNLDQAIKLFPAAAVLYCRRGDTLRELGTVDAALKDYNQAILVSATAVCAYTGRGLVFEREGKLEAAKGELEKASRMQVDLDSDPVSGREAQAVAKARVAVVDRAINDRKLAQTAPNQRLAELEEQTRNLRELLESEKRRRAEEEAKKTLEPIIDMGRRVALVIGNSAYQGAAPLTNPKGDAEAVGAALTQVGFDTVMVRLDLDRRKLLAALREFELEAEKADWAVIYYAGHGIEVGGTNYLIPVDAALTTDRDAGDEAVPLERVITSLQQTKKLRLVVLDACRENPFASKMKRLFSRPGKGLADIEPEGGVIVAYAARGGQVAFDGAPGQRSPFVSALLKHIKTPKLDIGLMFRRVSDEVMSATGKKQQPFIYGSPPGENLFFAAK